MQKQIPPLGSVPLKKKKKTLEEKLRVCTTTLK